LSIRTVILTKCHLLAAYAVDYGKSWLALNTLAELISESAVGWVGSALAKSVNIKTISTGNANVVGQNVVINALHTHKVDG
jgi:hypothetical protein